MWKRFGEIRHVELGQSHPKAGHKAKRATSAKTAAPVSGVRQAKIQQFIKSSSRNGGTVRERHGTGERGQN